jgi:heat shock protein HtpX
MMRAYGLYGHIRSNQLRSAVLLTGFVLLLQALLYSFYLIFIAILGNERTVVDMLAAAAENYRRSWWLAMLGALAWFVISWFFHRSMIMRATGAADVARAAEPELYNTLENLCISRGLTMPALQIIETDALNAYASGLEESDALVAVTRGLINTLTKPEMEAVLAHELTHIRNKDTQLMVVAIIFAGVFGFLGDLAFRRWDFPYGASPRHRRDRNGDSDNSSGGWSGTSSSGNSKKKDGDGGGGGGAAIIAIIIAVVIILISWGISTLIRFALSRSREYLADAGAVELTKNPDAMIAALRKIEAKATFEVPSRMEAFFIESPVKSRMTGLFDTHPAMSDRIAAIQRFAAGRDPGALDVGAAAAQARDMT